LEGLWFKASQGKKYMRLHLNQWLSARAGACHPKIYGRLRLGGSQFQAIWGVEAKKLMRSHLTRTILGVVVCVCQPSYAEKHK
jgi:hypothetical protein